MELREYDVEPPKLDPRWIKKRRQLVFMSSRDPELVAPQAYDNPDVYAWWVWLLTKYEPRAPLLVLVEPQRTRPHTKSTTWKRFITALSNVGAWDPASNEPNVAEPAVLSVLLALVPYDMAEFYPACCYSVDVYDVFRCRQCYRRLFTVLAELLKRLPARGVKGIGFLLSRPLLALVDHVLDTIGGEGALGVPVEKEVVAGTDPRPLVNLVLRLARRAEVAW